MPDQSTQTDESVPLLKEWPAFADLLLLLFARSEIDNLALKAIEIRQLHLLSECLLLGS